MRLSRHGSRITKSRKAWGWGGREGGGAWDDAIVVQGGWKLGKGLGEGGLVVRESEGATGLF